MNSKINSHFQLFVLLQNIRELLVHKKIRLELIVQNWANKVNKYKRRFLLQLIKSCISFRLNFNEMKNLILEITLVEFRRGEKQPYFTPIIVMED